MDDLLMGMAQLRVRQSPDECRYRDKMRYIVEYFLRKFGQTPVARAQILAYLDGAHMDFSECLAPALPDLCAFFENSRDPARVGAIVERLVALKFH